SYAVDAADVAEVIRVPPAAHVPHSPKALVGLANLRGAVLPIVSLRALLGLPDFALGPSARVIVLETGTRVGLVVDVVETLVEIAANLIEARAADLGAATKEQIVAAFQARMDGPPHKVLDLASLLADAFAQRTRATIQRRIPSRADNIEREENG